MIIFFFFILTGTLLNLMTRRFALSTGRFFGNLWYFVDRRHRHVAIRNLLMAFRNTKSLEKIRRLARDLFRHIGMATADAMRIRKIINSPDAENNTFMKIEGIELVEKAFKTGKGVLFAVAHYGNWELMVLAGKISPRPIFDIAQMIKNNLLERHIEKTRSLAGMRFIGKDNAARKILAYLKENCGMAIFMDQNAGREGIYVPFFGRKASTYPTVATLERRTSAKVIVAYCVMQKDYRYRFVFEEPPEFVRTENREEDIEKNTSALVKRFEEIIREKPEQYFWVHQRWKPIQNDLMQRQFRRIESILIKVPNWLGDIVMATPAISYIRKIFPEARISVLVKEHLAEILKHCPDIDEIMTYEIHTGLMRLRDEIGIIKRIKKEYFNLAVVLPYSLSSALWVALSRIPVRIGSSARARKLLLNHPVSPRRNNEHQRDYFMRIAGVLGTRILDLQASIATGADNNEKAQKLISGSSKNKKHIIGIHPGAAYGPAKRWHTERFGEVAKRLSENGALILLFGTANEKKILDEIMSFSDGTFMNLCEKLSLGELASVMKKCDIVLANDSGPMHLAGAVGTKVVGIFGSTSPRATSPDGKVLTIWKGVDCSPCFDRQCKRDFRCMNEISVDEVYEAINNLLRNATE